MNLDTAILLSEVRDLDRLTTLRQTWVLSHSDKCSSWERTEGPAFSLEI